jgi:hypothetical protein
MVKLLIAALVISIIGIFAFLFIATQTPKVISGKAISESIQVTGKILQVKSYQEFKILVLQDYDVVCFKCDFRLGDNIKAQGTLEDYQGRKQINAEKIELIK